MTRPDSAGLGGAIGSLAIAASFVVVLLSLFRIDHAPWPAAAALVAFAILAAARPSPALLIVAAGVPVATYTGVRLHNAVAWPEAIVVAFSAGWWLRSAARAQAPPGLPAALKILCILFSTLLALSVIAQLSVLRLTLESATVAATLWRHVSADYFVAAGTFPPLQAAALLLEGLVLFAATARLTAADPKLLRRLGGALAGGAALAAALSIQELATRASRGDTFWPALIGSIAGERFNTHYGDVNAAGSHYAMLLFVAGGLVWSRGRGWRTWTLPFALIAIGLWMSGSRTALLACPLALAALLPLRMWRASRARTVMIWTGGVALALILFAALVFLPSRRNHAAPSVATQLRIELSKTALRMAREGPVYGIGLGQFQQRSGEFSSPELLRIFPPAINENAHNNFFQILAEQGIAGFALFMGLIVVSFAYACGRGGAASLDVLAWACAAGVLAFLLTCLGGHPLLIREPAFSFWILLGAVAGAGAAVRHVAHPPAPIDRRAGAFLAIALLAMAASVPHRARAHGRSANLEHLGFGVSPLWETAPDGVRYRQAVNDGSVYVPAGSGFRFRLQPISDDPVSLELRLDGRLANIVVLAPGQWNDITMPLPSSSTGARFYRLDLRVLDRTGDVPVWITKVEPIP